MVNTKLLRNKEKNKNLFYTSGSFYLLYLTDVSLKSDSAL